MKKKTQSQHPKPFYILILVSIVVVTIAAGLLLWANYDATHRKISYEMPLLNHTIPYVDGSTNGAVGQVESFYAQYTNGTTKKLNSYSKMVDGYGSKNLRFYYDYYQHGFDPIVCSSEIPTKTTVSLASTGPVAHVNVRATYPDNTEQLIKTTVVLNDDGLKIDSVTCPDNKGNLPPKL